MIGEDALAAVSLAFPLQSLMIAFSTGIGVGINSQLSRALGEKRPQRANRIAASGVILELFFTLLFVLTGLFLAVPFFRAQTARYEHLLPGCPLHAHCLLRFARHLHGNHL